jgi:hypothetical protein
MKKKPGNVAGNIFFFLFSLGGAALFSLLLWRDVNLRFTANNSPSVGQIIRAARTVQRQASRRNIWEVAVAGLPLYPGDRIRTGDSSAVRINLSSGDVIDLGSNTLITVQVTKENAGLIALETGVVIPVTSTGEVFVQTDTAGIKPLESVPVYAAARFTPVPAGSVSALEEAAPAEPLQRESPGSASPQTPVLPEAVYQELAEAERVEPEVQTIEPERRESALRAENSPPAFALSAPENLRPQGAIGRAELARAGGVVFSWNPVPEATGYVWTLRTASGTLLRSEKVTTVRYTVSEPSLFVNNRSLRWTVQAVAERDGADIRSGEVSRSLEVNLPRISAPAPNQPEAL